MAGPKMVLSLIRDASYPFGMTNRLNKSSHFSLFLPTARYIAGTGKFSNVFQLAYLPKPVHQRKKTGLYSLRIQPGIL